MRSLNSYIKQKQNKNKELKLIPYTDFEQGNTELLTLSTFDEWIEQEELNKKEIKRL